MLDKYMPQTIIVSVQIRIRRKHMRSVKSVALFLGIMVVLTGSAFAGAPTPVMERPVPVETYTPAPTPAPVADDQMAKPLIISKHGTWGIGLGGNPIIGIVEKDQYGYPRSEYTGPFYGINWVLGFGVTTFSGQPSADEINTAVIKVKKANPGIADKDIPNAVRTELGNNPLTYVHLGTALLVLPINAEIGYQWIISDNCRTRLGVGIPTILCFGINWDF
jgi:hypothetical protein